MKTISIDDQILVVECRESGTEECSVCNHYRNCHLVQHDSRGVIFTVLISLTLLVSAALLWGLA